MDEDDDKDDSKRLSYSLRKSRNLSEKKRRDQFNGLVNELSTMVSSATRKMDKSTVLKSTISFLKNHNEVAVRSKIHEIREDWKPSFLSNEEFTHLILEALDGFIIVFSTNGQILYASESITPLLGHLPSDLLNMSIYDLTFEEDHTDLYNMLLSPHSIVDPVQDCLTNENQVCFSCHLKRGGLDFRDEGTYELVEFIGYFRSDMEVENISSSKPKNMGFISDADSKVIFVGTSRILKPQFIREMSIIGSTKSEFTSRHSLEWKFLFLDHRAPPIIGYLPFEVLGTSGYDYYHFDDFEQVLLCHESLKQKGEGTSCFYRFLTKGQQWIWIQTRYYITYHQWTSKPEFVVCTHRVINYNDAMHQLRSKDVDDSNVDDSTDSVERQLNTPASSMMITTTSSSSSPWSARRSRSRINATGSNNKSRQRHHTYHGCSSESAYLKLDTPSSQYSNLTQPSSRTISHSLKTSPQHHSHSQPMHSGYDAAQTRTISIPGSLKPYTTESQQFLTSIPVQPVLATVFPTSTTSILSPLPSQLPEIIHPGLVMTSTQTILQDQLQRKHEELQQLIVHQQDELRRVSEQLIMARYGMPIVAVPYTSVPSVPVTNNQSISDRKAIQHQPTELQPITHPLQNAQQLDLSETQLQIVATTSQQQHYHMDHSQQHLHYSGHTVDGAGTSTEITSPQSLLVNADEMISYMQLTPVSTVHMSHEYSHLLHREENNSMMQLSDGTDCPIEAQGSYKMMDQTEDDIMFGNDFNNTQSRTQ